MLNFDIGIIGGGPAGYTAAFRAREKGLSVILFEKDKIGGVCLNKGCIPTKAILHSAQLYEEIKSAHNLGINAENTSINYPKIIEHKDSIVEKLRKNLELSLKNAGVTIVYAEAEIVSSNTTNSDFNPESKIIKANEKIYICNEIISATGSSPKDFDNLKFDHEFILSSDDILELTQLPKNILIVGSGAIGIEWTRILTAFDVEVSIIELADHLLPIADVEVSKRIERIFKTKKIKMYLNNSIDKIENKNVYLKTGEILTPEKILIAVGRKPEKLINCDICIGDACGKIQLAHFAIKQALNAISGTEFDETLVPSVIYGCPEIAWIGKREQDLQENTFQKSNLLVSALGKSHCDNCTEGFIKILSQNGKIIGAHIVSKEASSLIQQIAIAMQNNLSIEDLKKVCFAHPTYSEGIFESLFRHNESM